MSSMVTCVAPWALRVATIWASSSARLTFVVAVVAAWVMVEFMVKTLTPRTRNAIKWTNDLTRHLRHETLHSAVCSNRRVVRALGQHEGRVCDGRRFWPRRGH